MDQTQDQQEVRCWIEKNQKFIMKEVKHVGFSPSPCWLAMIELTFVIIMESH